VILGVSLSGTRRYLEQQLASHAQDAATAMSITLVPSLAKGDTVLAQTQVMSVFDRGYYKRVDVLAADRTRLVSKELPEHIEGVPTWFSNQFPIETAQGEAHISSGWRQLGKVLVVSQPTQAYQYLWWSAVDMGLWLALIYVFALVLTQMHLHFILWPLRMIEDSARAIQHKRFEQITSLPKAPELSRVVKAMNDMSRRVAEMLDEQTEHAATLLKKAYEDEQTGLVNRRGFELELKELLEGDYQFTLAGMIFVELDDMRAFGRSHGFSEVVAVLTTVTGAAEAALKGEHVTLMGRANEFTFSFILAGLSEEELVARADALRKRLADDIGRLPASGNVAFDIGMTYFRQDEHQATIFARSDLAVESARHSGRNGLVVLPDKRDDFSELGSFGWRMLIQSALNENRLFLVSQPAVRLASRTNIVHEELLARLLDTKGNLVPAMQFLPMAVRHDLMRDVDCSLVVLAISYLGITEKKDKHFAINLSSQSIANRQFVGWLAEQLDFLKLDARRLSFEISEIGCLRDIESALTVMDMVHKFGAKFGIDNFGLDSRALKLLRQIPSDYVKLNSGVISTITTDTQAREIVKSIVRLAHSLDIQVFAMSVETEAQVAMLLGLAVDGAQGYLFGAPV
jgi:EAL domain-containing protein (putative c-di-GMP-specific phosphodiesterase class I)/GGDEF domain-containing protein